jgi:hypothetical protein
MALREGLTFAKRISWYTKRRVRDLPQDALLCATLQPQLEAAALMVRGLLVHLWITSDDACWVDVYAAQFSAGDFEAVIDQLSTWLVHREAPSEERVEMAFRSGEQRGGRYSRLLDAPSWAEIRGNYAESVQHAVDSLATDFKPAAGGRLLLFHGPPGTGKTYVVRALAREWRSWCAFEYIVDPEAFFGNGDYMMRVLLQGEDCDYGEEPRESRWRLLVIEDAGELLARDAKQRQGQGLSRLLNLSEGLIGQGLRVLVLITTNEKLQSLNEAVARPGRTAAEVEFTALTVEESNGWLEAHGSEERVISPVTLAELYALASGHRRESHKPARKIGFLRE